MTVLWVGAYGPSMSGDARGVSALRLAGRGLQYLGISAATESPSYLAHSAIAGVIYAVNEGAGRVGAFRRGHNGVVLDALGEQETTGTLPCHILATQEWLYVSNYGSGSVDVFPLLADGTIGTVAQTLNPAVESGVGPGPEPEQQDGGHAHSTLAFGDTVLVADLGTDRVFVYRRVDGELTVESAIEFPAGTGPRDLVVAPAAGKIFLLGELSGTVFALGGGRQLRIMRAGTPAAQPGDHAAGLVVEPSGRFLYAGMRGSDRIVVFDSLTLEPLGELPSGGTTPRNLCTTDGYVLAANQDSGTVNAFWIDQESGLLTPSGQPLFVDSPTFLLPDTD